MTTNKKDKKYTISNISENQLRLISKSLELYTRLGILQLERAIIDDISWSDNFTYLKNRDLIDFKLKEIRSLLVDKPGYENYGISDWSLGIGHKDAPKSTSITYEMHNDINDYLIPDRLNKGKLKLCDEDDIIVENSNDRLNKLINVIDKLKK